MLNRVKAQDPAAWDRLVHLYTPLVYRWCRQRGLQEADALDVGQEVFKAVHRKIGDFRRAQPGDTFRGWLRKITAHKIGDFHRHQPPERAAGGSEALAQSRQVPAPEPPDGDSETDHEETSLLYRRALELIQGEFHEKTWKAFLAAAVDGRPTAEVAVELKMSPNAVYLAKARIRKRLEEEFEDLIDP